jgi:hypothetical protein
MDTGWTSFMIVIMEIGRTEEFGGMTAPERSALAEQFGISEELLLRYQRAHHVYCTTVYPKMHREAMLEARLRTRDLGKGPEDPEFIVELEKALDRVWAATPENEITRESTEASAALKAALEAAAPKK